MKLPKLPEISMPFSYTMPAATKRDLIDPSPATCKAVDFAYLVGAYSCAILFASGAIALSTHLLRWAITAGP